MPRILIATSIAPGARIAIQQKAIQSWLMAGFEVVSLNAKTEIEALQADFPGIAFVPVERTAKLLTGRHHVFIDDIIYCLKTSGTEVVGIANSDIVLELIPNLTRRLADAASRGLICCPRLDVGGPDETIGSIDSFGYDLIFFRTEITALWGKTRFCLGQGYWDHYLPLMAILRGHPTIKLVPPIGRHVAHDIARDDNFFLFADEFAALVSGFMTGVSPGDFDWTRFGHGFPKEAYAELRRNIESGRQQDIESYAHHIDALTRYVIRFIDANSRHVSIAE